MTSKAFKAVLAGALIAATCASVVNPAFAIGFDNVRAEDPAPSETYIPWQPMENPTSGFIPPSDLSMSMSESMGMGSHMSSGPSVVSSQPETPRTPDKFTRADVKALTAKEFAALSDDELAKIPAASFSEVSWVQLRTLNAERFAKLTPEAIAAIPENQFSSLDVNLFFDLTPAQVAVLSDAKLNAALRWLPPQTAAAISPDAFSRLLPNALIEMAPLVLQKLTDAQIASVKPETIKNIQATKGGIYLLLRTTYSDSPNAAAAESRVTELQTSFGAGILQTFVRWIFNELDRGVNSAR
jgi:hypothetical protein